MKRYIIILAVATCVFQGCEKLETEGVSYETQFVDFTMEGEPLLSVVKGETYEEPGVTAKEGDEEKEVTISGTVDVNTVGIYEIVYSATNNDGYPGSVTRRVVVLPEAEHEGVDISGSYSYNSGGQIAQVTKIIPGFYLMSNVWGPSEVPCNIITSDGQNLTLALTNTVFGRVTGSGTLNGSSMALIVSMLDQNGLIDIPRNWTKR